MTLRVLHLVGSAVSDFYADLSRLYAEDCLRATADPTRYEVRLAYVTPDRCWRFPDDLSVEGISAAPPVSIGDAVSRLLDLQLDVVVPQMFCLPGMTTYRALFDLLFIPYVGNPPDVMALAAHKARARGVVAAAGVRVPAGEVLRAGERPGIAVPAVVKPVDADNSFGVALVSDPTDYVRAVEQAFGYSEEVLVERYVELGREVRCGVIALDHGLVCLPLEEYAMDRVRKPVRGGSDKITRAGDGTLSLVAKEPARAWIVDPDDPVTAVVWDTAVRCYRALGCRHYGLFDFRIDPDGQPWFLEAGLYCSFAEQSVITTMGRVAGITLPDLFARLLRDALPPAGPGRTGR